ncbi:hypothetical protein IWQ47_001737 [Aquimarina sp. EL_43]|uniref:hypothetical protein n=1 Tax=unclassified Aquimarina TaxID=2627091 RepID=UPI0018C9F204|nr:MULTISPECIES: hypothetical protein [unclassified Aquimarina]MBG6130180.1 hypothetical protein [Aquimarina sp. EL_35]MBG6148960.1 hypothetical protein [Aquimarina sp. EL_32]MBG6168666.1 hypothetical protein [Aquimarina sp. EL_43]
MKNTTLIKSVDSRLDSDIGLPYHASSLAYDLLLLNNQSDKSQEVLNMNSRFKERLFEWGLNDILNTQFRYAIRIANSEGVLEYEEMHKLFSLCDEIYALEILGISFDNSVKSEFITSVRKRFANERKKASMVAQDKIETWKSNLWWYNENI